MKSFSTIVTTTARDQYNIYGIIYIYQGSIYGFCNAVMFTNMPVLLLIHLCDIDIGTDNLFVKNSAIHTFSCVFCTRALINGLRHWLAALGLCCPITDV